MLQTPSPNFNDRKPYDESGRAEPSMLILHYTGMRSAQEALARLCDPMAEVSAHFLVDEDGTCHQMVDPENRAWHAGVSYWRGVTDINSASIGIEIVNPGHEFGYRGFPDAQMQAVVRLCKDLMQRFAIPAANVLGHSDVAPSRKEDPGELFDWRGLALDGVGSWPDIDAVEDDFVQELLRDEAAQREAFIAVGYDPEADLDRVVIAFQRRYNPQRVIDGHGALIDERGARILAALARGY